MVFLFFLIINLQFLITAVNADVFNSTAELVIPTGTPSNRANAEIVTKTLSRTENKKTIRVI